MFKKTLGLNSDIDICARLGSNLSRRGIAAISELVARAARDGDIAATRIFERAACELAAIVEAVRQALEFGADEAVPLSYSGGIFNAGDLIIAPLRGHIAQYSESYDLRAPIMSPCLGAAIYAARLAGQPMSATAIERLRQETS
jgi:N-acetylglucosamine kinase-like BadF-type ATPase